MTLSTEGYKGTRDFFPKDMQFRNWMFGKLRDAVQTFGYLEYGGPMLESFDLYAAKSGEELVNQQIYSLIDRGDRKLAVRPEMTPTLARMVAQKINELPRPIRLFSIPNLWRYERPQRGRLREHWQLNVDVLGGDPLLADAEILTLAQELIQSFGGKGKIEVRVNHRKLMDVFFRENLKLTPEQALKVVKAIDAKDKITEEKFLAWVKESGVAEDQLPVLNQFFSATLSEIQTLVPGEGAEHLAKLFKLLEESGVSGHVKFVPTIMRGLDYYTGTVFEIYDVSPENNRALFGGGRYDNLMSIFGKEALSGVGFGMGDVSLQNFLETHKLVPEFKSEVDVFMTLPDLKLRETAEKLTRNLRDKGLKVLTPLQVGNFGTQLKLANRHSAKFAVLFGEDELKMGQVLLKDLRTGVQTQVEIDSVSGHILDKI